jgi:hypothetical protein
MANPFSNLDSIGNTVTEVFGSLAQGCTNQDNTSVAGLSFFGNPNIATGPASFNALTAAMLSTNGPFGDGSDGALVMTGDISMIRDMFWTTGDTGNGGFNLFTNGFRAYFNSTFTVHAADFVKADGNSASGATAGAATHTGTLGGGAAGGAGALQNGPNGLSIGHSYGGNGGNAGAGSAGTGGSGGTVTAPGATEGSAHDIRFASLGHLIGAGALNLLQGGAGGGGAGGNAAQAGGGGGSGGGVMVLCAKTLVNAGTISAKGGQGANGTATNTGGGGGGGGGTIFLVTGSLTNTGSITAAHGTAGSSGGGAGVNGSNGADGTVFTLAA